MQYGRKATPTGRERLPRDASVQRMGLRTGPNQEGRQPHFMTRNRTLVTTDRPSKIARLAMMLVRLLT